VLQALPVLAVGGRAAGPVGAMPDVDAVTVLVHPGQAETLARASAVGAVSLALRKPDEDDYQLTAGVQQAIRPRAVPEAVRDLPDPRPESAQTGFDGYVRTIRGTQVEEIGYHLEHDEVAAPR